MDLTELLQSWQLHLRAERKTPHTVKTYTAGVLTYLDWCDRTGSERVIDRRQVSQFIVDMLDAGAEPSSARSRLTGIRRFSAWLADQEEIPADPLIGIKPPKLDVKVTEPLTEDELKRMLKACQGKHLMDRRDEAVLRLMIEAGIRAGEMVAMTTADIDLPGGLAVVRRGKGGRGRVVPFGPVTAAAIDRYLRLRKGHRHASSDTLWLGERGKGFSYASLWKALKGRATVAGVDRFHPHLLRHTAAHRWLAAGGSDSGLMAVAGWTRPDMLLRYTRARASDRAADEARKLGLGDL
jgi:integrase/recombinase XerD